MVTPSRPDRTKTPAWNPRRAPSLSVSPSRSPPLHLWGPRPEPSGTWDNCGSSVREQLMSERG